jgi:hypothetical protein
MKRNLLAIALFIAASHIANAQTSGSSSTNSPSESSSQAKSGKSKKGQIDSLNERKVYKWKDGQQATPTGHEATGTGGTESPLPKDSATMQSDSTRHYQ